MSYQIRNTRRRNATLAVREGALAVGDLRAFLADCEKAKLGDDAKVKISTSSGLIGRVVNIQSESIEELSVWPRT